MVTGNQSSAGSPSPYREVIIPPWWEEAAESITHAASSPQPPVAVICGPKNSGKSTFSRHLLNNLIHRYKRVGYLDTDVGQPEFSPPGCLSLHIINEIIPDLANPSLKEPERCFFYGDISSKRDPEAYLNHVFDLYDYFVEHFRSNGISGESVLPLIINTPGWVKGTGFDILVEILRNISPTVVVQVRISADRKNLPGGAFWLDSEQTGPLDLIDISSAQQDALNRSVLVQKDAGAMRDRRILDYFKQCFPNDNNDTNCILTNKELAYALASLPPYRVPFSKVKIFHLHFQVPSREIWHSLNGTIVGLAVSSERPVKARYNPWCIGLGMVRGIDVARGILYVITPVPIQSLQNVDILLQGLIEIPTSLLHVRGCVSPYMATNVVHKISHKDL